MLEQDVLVTTKYGPCPSFAVCPDGAGSYPGVIFYMDAPGIREELRNMARRIAKHGYFVLLPDQYYRLGTLRFDVARRDDSMAPVFLQAMHSLTNAKVMDDTGGWIAWMDAQEQCKAGCRLRPEPGQYCMSVRNRGRTTRGRRHKGRAVHASQ